jgi:hypothetical protein
MVRLPRHKRHKHSGGMYLFGGDHPPVNLFVLVNRQEKVKWADECAVEQLLVGYYQCQQYQQRMEREFEQWQREQQQ